MPKIHRHLRNKKPPHLTDKAVDKKEATSWGAVAKWYDNYLETGSDSYQEKVVAPNLIRILEIKKGMKVLDNACGQGFFSRKFKTLGADVTGADISSELIAQAKKHGEGIVFHATPADKLPFAKDGTFDVVTIVLAIQNISDMQSVFAECSRVLKKGGRLVLVLNHPTFRIPKRSSWDFDPRSGMQYRRIDGYLSSEKVSIVMNPGQAKSESTISYHRPLQEFFKALSKSGLTVARLEEWISHKKSEKGPRQKAEDLSRKEIPLFMMIEAVK